MLSLIDSEFSLILKRKTLKHLNLVTQFLKKEKEARKNYILSIQQEISQRKNQEKIGKRLKVLIDEQIEKNTYLGRTQWDAPEVDNSVIVNSNFPIEPGKFYEVEIDDALEFDLAGQVI